MLLVFCERRQRWMTRTRPITAYKPMDRNSGQQWQMKMERKAINEWDKKGDGRENDSFCWMVRCGGGRQFAMLQFKKRDDDERPVVMVCPVTGHAQHMDGVICTFRCERARPRCGIEKEKMYKKDVQY